VQAKEYGEYNNYHSQADQNAAQLWVHERLAKRKEPQKWDLLRLSFLSSQW
jgi:hypothetical protein